MIPSIDLFLAGARILVVEDDYLIADEIGTTLSNAGLEIIGPVGTIEQALRHIELSRIDGALVDINLRGEMSYPVLDRLIDNGIPAMLVTGYDAHVVPAVYAGIPILNKPAALDAIVAYFGGPDAPPASATRSSIARPLH